MAKFKVEDFVSLKRSSLKNGNPIMVITKIGKNGLCTCVWYTKEKRNEITVSPDKLKMEEKDDPIDGVTRVPHD
jgi:uncharacterized protein YodC (DUF2158 family)